MYTRKWQQLHKKRNFSRSVQICADLCRTPADLYVAKPRAFRTFMKQVYDIFSTNLQLMYNKLNCENEYII